MNRYKQKTIISVMAVLLSFVSQAGAEEAYAYTKYCNARYGFCVEYPVDFGMEPSPINNDGRVFYDGEGYSMRAYGSQNALEHGINDEIKDEKEEFDIVTYKRVKNNWFVLSGYEDEDIVYLKTYMNTDKSIFYHLRISYPTKFKTKYGRLVSKVSKSFKPRP